MLPRNDTGTNDTASTSNPRMPVPIALDYRPALLSRAGIGRATRELARALAEIEDLRVHLFGHSFARARVSVATPVSAQLHRLPIPGRLLPALRRLGLGAEQLAGGAALVHWTDYIQPPTRSAQRVLTVHDLAFVRDPRWHGADAAALRERTRAAVGAATALTAPTRATAADLRDFAPEAPAARVIPWGADHVPTARLPAARGDGDYVLCVGTVEPRKNHLGLLAAWRQLPPPRPQLVVVGAAGWECAEIVRALAEAEREGLLTWRRSASDQELWSLMQHARALVYPSLWEGFGFPPLEAMALGLPVVTHDVAPLREVCEDAARYADATDPAALADAIAVAVGDERARAGAVRAGLALAARRTWRRCAEEHAALYREVLA